MVNQIRKLYVANFLGNLYFYLPVSTLFLLSNGVNLRTIMLGSTMYSVVSVIMEVPTGIWADRFGHHRAAAIGYAVDAVFLLAVALQPTATVFVAACALRGLTGAFLSGSREALVYEYGKDAGRSYKKDYSHLISYEVLGFATGAGVAGLMVQKMGEASYVPAFLLSFLAVMGAAGLALSLKPHKTERPLGLKRLHELEESLKLFKRNRMLKYIFIVTGLTYGGKYILTDLYPPHLEVNHVAPFFLGWALAIGSMAQYFIIRHSYKIERIFGPRNALVVLAAATGLGYVIFGLATNPVVLIIGFTLLFGILESSSVFVSDYANQHAQSGIRATVLSGIGFSREIAKAAYKGAIGLMLGIFLLPEVLLLYGIFLVAGGLMSYWLLKRAERHADTIKA